MSGDARFIRKGKLSQLHYGDASTTKLDVFIAIVAHTGHSVEILANHRAQCPSARAVKNAHTVLFQEQASSMK